MDYLYIVLDLFRKISIYVILLGFPTLLLATYIPTFSDLFLSNILPKLILIAVALSLFQLLIKPQSVSTRFTLDNYAIGFVVIITILNLFVMFFIKEADPGILQGRNYANLSYILGLTLTFLISQGINKKHISNLIFTGLTIALMAISHDSYLLFIYITLVVLTEVIGQITERTKLTKALILVSGIYLALFGNLFPATLPESFLYGAFALLPFVFTGISIKSLTTYKSLLILVLVGISLNNLAPIVLLLTGILFSSIQLIRTSEKITFKNIQKSTYFIPIVVLLIDLAIFITIKSEFIKILLIPANEFFVWMNQNPNILTGLLGGNTLILSSYYGTLLTNFGILGLLAFTSLLLALLNRYISNKIILFIVLFNTIFFAFINVTGLSFYTIWILLGLIHIRTSQEKKKEIVLIYKLQSKSQIGILITEALRIIILLVGGFLLVSIL